MTSPKRFYKLASIAKAEQGQFAIMLDDRQVKTPARNPLLVPARALGLAIADEWQEQEEAINPQTMPLTGFANAAIDHGTANRDAFIQTIVRFADTDMVSYRGDAGTELWRRQEAQWSPLVTMLEARHNTRWLQIEGVLPQPQSPAVLGLAKKTADALDPFALIAFAELVQLTGSFAMALAVTQSYASADEIWRASCLEELWQAEQWGEDSEAKAARDKKYARYSEVWKFWQLLQQD